MATLVTLLLLANFGEGSLLPVVSGMLMYLACVAWMADFVPPQRGESVAVVGHGLLLLLLLSPGSAPRAIHAAYAKHMWMYLAWSNMSNV